jgi:hypothetical protein
MKLDRGAARIMILGRDTAFHDDHEFRSAILGRQTTASGQEIAVRGRRACRPIQLREFTLIEARQFVKNYFSLKVEQEATRSGAQLDKAWISSRTAELLGGEFNELIVRPVHAQMLCEIATEPKTELNAISKFRLYDQFVHYLFDREVEKRGRHSAFTRDVRRKFNAALAWWLWERGGASTTTFADLPQSICADAARGINHDFDDVGLKRELTCGCLVEKGAGTVYFTHRSIQEFLVAEYLFSENLGFEGRADDITAAANLLTPEIVDFLLGWFEGKPGKEQEWLGYVGSWRGGDVSLQGFRLFALLACKFPRAAPDKWLSPRSLWLHFFSAQGIAEFSASNLLRDEMSTLLQEAGSKSIEMQAAILWFLAKTLRKTAPIRIVEGTTRVRVRLAFVAEMLASWVPLQELKKAVEKARKGVTSIALINRDESFMLWAFANVVRVKNADGDPTLRIDVRLLEKIARERLRGALDGGSEGGATGDETQDFSVSSRGLYIGLANLGATNRELDETIRPYVNDPKLRLRIRPLVVTRNSLRGE